MYLFKNKFYKGNIFNKHTHYFLIGKDSMIINYFKKNNVIFIQLYFQLYYLLILFIFT